MNRLIAALLGLLAAAISFSFWYYGDSLWQWALLPWLYIAAGLIAWNRRPDNRTGMLMVATGVAYWAFGLETLRTPVLWTIGLALEQAFLPALAFLLLSFPSGHLRRRWERVLVASAAGWVLLFTVAASLQFEPALVCDCSRELNLLLLDSHPQLEDALHQFYEAAALPKLLLLEALFLTLAGVCLVRWWTASRPMRRVLGTVLLAAIPLLLALAVQGVFNHLGLGPSHPRWERLIWIAGMYAGLVHPLAYLVGLLAAWARRTRIGELLVELDGVSRLDNVEAAMGRALGDPTLRLRRWDAEAQRYLTSEGKPVHIDEETRCAVTFLERDGRPLAAVTYDPALLDDRGLLDSVTAAARLAIDNERLQAEIHARLDEVRASRARIVAATDVERRRLERDLHDGAQQRLVALALDARIVEARLSNDADPAVRDSVAAIVAGLGAALQELRELARGIHPQVLTDEGLTPALRSLAERSAVPTRLIAISDRRYTPAVEATAYFVASEALANAAKHAQASEVTISIGEQQGLLRLEVTDDGIGGADPARGSGLHGLADRVATIDGRLEVRSLPGNGTTVIAEIPCVSS